MAWTTTGALTAILQTAGGSKVIRTHGILLQQAGRCDPSSLLPQIPPRFPLRPTTGLDFTRVLASARGLCDQLIKSNDLCVHKPGGKASTEGVGARNKRNRTVRRTPAPCPAPPHAHRLAGGLSPHQIAHLIPGCCRGQPLKRCSPGQARFLWISRLAPFPPEWPLCSAQTRYGGPLQGLCSPHPCSQPPSLQNPDSETLRSCHNMGLPLTPVTLQPHGPAKAYTCPALAQPPRGQLLGLGS